MKRVSSRHEVDMLNGPVMPSMIRFAIPLMLTNILALFYHAADMIVVGRFASATALAAVGATGALNSLLVNLFIGFATGASVAVSQYFGAGDFKGVSQSVHTSILLSVLCGVGIGIVGIVFARPLLALMGTPEDVIDQSVLYLSIIFAGMPFNLLYTFCAGIMRAVGDTKRPLYYLILSGFVNVMLNLVFVIFFHMSVAGVALATVISQLISAYLGVRNLLMTDSCVRLLPNKLRIHADKLLLIIRIGLPVGLQSSLFSISNTLIQSSINSFGSIAMAGNTAASNIEGFVSGPLGAFYSATLSFTSQNYGARKPERFNRIMGASCALITGIGFLVGLLVVFFREPLLGIYSSDPAIISYGAARMIIMAPTCFIACLAESFGNGMRGMGNSFVPMIISLLSICGLRILWIFTAFAMFRTPEVLYFSYPLSWFVNAVILCVCYFSYRRKVVARMAQEALAN